MQQATETNAGKALNILVRTPNWIGDHVMAGRFYRGLRQAYPKARITFLCPSVLRDFPDGSDVCNEKIVLAETSVKKLREKHFDIAVGLPASIRSAFLLFGAGIPYRIAFAEVGAEIFLTSHLRWKGRDAGKHKSELYLDLLRFLTAKECSAQTEKETVSLKRRDGGLVIAPGASIPLREWPYVEGLLARIAFEAPHVSISIIGSDRKWAGLSGANVTNYVGKTSLSQVVALCETAKVVLANDSGIAHVAATVAQAPTLVLFGPGDPQYVLPRGPASGIRYEALPCSPCEKPYCRAPYGYQRCLTEISVDEVWQRLKPFLCL